MAAGSPVAGGTSSMYSTVTVNFDRARVTIGAAAARAPGLGTAAGFGGSVFNTIEDAAGSAGPAAASSPAVLS